ncbi:MAG: RsmB/NOP family class I SAM-dependent RNA methyltransferase, partial [Bacteroidota bacterium]
MRTLLGDEYDSFLHAFSSPPPTSIRFNTFKPTEVFGDAAVVPWCSEGRYLNSRPQFTLDPLFHAGCYYVQEASSMFIEQALMDYQKKSRVRTVLDLCAAPGGKSTHLRSLIPEDALLVSNEMISSRNAILSENISKWGHPGVIITRNSPDSLVGSTFGFDVVLVDAPCSGEGLFRKDPQSINEWSPEAVVSCALRQRSILDVAVELLSPGGLLIYSTCTWSEDEDERIVEHLIGTHSFVPVRIELPSGVVQSSGGYRFYPHRTQGEGFFLSALVKSAGDERPRNRVRTAAIPGRNVKPDYFRLDGDFEYREINEKVRAYPAGMMNLLEELSSGFNIVHAGCLIGEKKGQ